MGNRRKQLSPQFGLSAKRSTKRQREKSAQINTLFDEIKYEYGLDSLAIFRAAADELHARFLNDVRSCPAFVLAYCQEHLAPDALAAHRKKKEIARQKALADLAREQEKLTKAAP
jgi:hypothetical protein